MFFCYIDKPSQNVLQQTNKQRQVDVGIFPGTHKELVTYFSL